MDAEAFNPRGYVTMQTLPSVRQMWKYVVEWLPCLVEQWVYEFTDMEWNMTHILADFPMILILEGAYLCGYFWYLLYALYLFNVLFL